MQKKWKKIIFIGCVFILLLLSLPRIAEQSSEKDVQTLEELINNL